ncbi:DUF3800 domain-containing protein [Limimaricola cinnabarinus]|uniref:DUF3800 domain-containing protein n=1 Tax=Limimaricola cinnabarinus TaxID=1125964 RepID=A0A2G1MFU1_9RHOB|nr:DUF3800 domain-containing protein [Limimaricola cinnabarinus]PHP27530.1 hypothetical protein CJ301_10240 [Limimaricola cinnabarinus]
MLTFYMDETGNRRPDKKPDASREGRDWFGFGGFLIHSDDEPAAKQAHKDFCDEWGVGTPFHITDMLGQYKGFHWLNRKKQAWVDGFWADYALLLCEIKAIGLACVVDRPGYVARGYLEEHGEDSWLLCRTAFDISVERAVKYAKMKGEKLRIVFESDPPFNPIVKGYFRDLKSNGLAFDKDRSSKYQPLEKEVFQEILSTIEYKDKSSKLLQFADSYIYSIARQKYDNRFGLYRHLRDRGCIMNFALDGDADKIRQMGIKYSCF